MIFLRYPFHCDLKVLDLGKTPIRTDKIKDEIAFSLGCNEFSLLYNGKRLLDEDVISDNSTLHVSFSLPGGKGGFGSMLRAIGAQIEKTTNREACRDLSGRRLRDINEEQRLKKWIAKEAEREQEKIKRRQARIERLKTKAPHKFFDFEYEKEISELPDRINDALSEGLQKTNDTKKRPHKTSESERIPKKSWMTEDFSGSSSDSDSGEGNIGGEGSPKKRKIAPEEFLCCQLKPKSSPSSSVSNSTSDNDSGKRDTSREGAQENMNMAPGYFCAEMPESTPYSLKNTSVTSPNSLKNSSLASDSDSRERNSNGEGSHETMKMALSPCQEVSESNPDSLKGSNLTSASGSECEVMSKSTPDTEAESSAFVVPKELEAKDDSPIDLMNFRNVSELEALGLDKLKSALMMHGLKCGGTLSDRAQRLWRIRGLQPPEYPKNLLAKSKK